MKGSDLFGIFTNNHVIPSEEEARKAGVTFGFEEPGERETMGLDPDLMFRTNEVSFFNIFILPVLNHSHERFAMYVNCLGFEVHTYANRLDYLYK